MLNQVFMNILVNACQSIEKKGTITISTSEGHSDVLFQNNYVSSLSIGLGGAIYNEGILGLYAENAEYDSITFTGNNTGLPENASI